MFPWDTKHFSTSVIAWIEAPYFTRSSMTLMRFFLQAMCSGVKPFCAKDSHVSSRRAATLPARLPAGTGRAEALEDQKRLLCKHNRLRTTDDPRSRRQNKAAPLLPSRAPPPGNARLKSTGNVSGERWKIAVFSNG